MEFDCTMISIVGVILVISLGYFVYLIYQDVLGLKSSVEEIKKQLDPEEDEEDEDEEDEEYDSEEETEYDGDDEEYDEEDNEKISEEIGRIFDIIDEQPQPQPFPRQPLQQPLPTIEEISPEDDLPPPKFIDGLPVFGPEEKPEGYVMPDPTEDVINNTSVKKTKKKPTKKKTATKTENDASEV